VSEIVDIFGKNGDKIGTARVLEGEEVEFYLKPGFSIRDDVKRKLAKQLKATVGKRGK
jgi:hypothetical protein